MWWLIGLLAALAASTQDSTRNTGVSAARSPVSDNSRLLTYRSRDGRSFFRFRFSPFGAGVRIFILEFPNPQIGSCHVLHDDRGAAYICWSRAINSLSDAKAVAALWAEATLVYQRTGHVF